MNKLGLAAAITTALSIEGCSSSKECHIKGGEVTGIYSIQKVLEVCDENRERFLKCVKDETGYNGDLVQVNIDCSSDNFDDQVSDAFDGDNTVCNADTDPDKITVECTEE